MLKNYFNPGIGVVLFTAPTTMLVTKVATATLGKKEYPEEVITPDLT
jgi:hypothetical protein